jgi:myo-inositol-1(or 4)-monophosphatase
MMKDAKAEVLKVAERAARAGSDVLLAYFGHVAVHEKESTQNVVSQADWASEQRITQSILESFPQHGLLREETAFEGNLLAEQLWVIDPLDATNNYIHGIPHFCVSIAYVERGRPQVGVVYDPMRDEMFRAVRGEGAWLNDRPIRVAEPDSLARSIIATGFYYDRGEMMERTLDAIRALFRRNIRGMRRMGGAALDLSWTACGRFAGYFEYQLAPWDYAAGWLLVEEAGGICLDRTGAPLELDSRSVIAASPAIREEFVKLVAWPDDTGGLFTSVAQQH